MISYHFHSFPLESALAAVAAAVPIVVGVVVVELVEEHIVVLPLDQVVDSELMASQALHAPMDNVDPVDNIGNWLEDMDALDSRIAVLGHKLLEVHILDSNFTINKTKWLVTHHFQ